MDSGNLNKERYRYIDDLSRDNKSFSFERSSCIVDECNDIPILSHLIPRSWQSLIARDGLVVNLHRMLPANTPTTREEQFYENYFQNVSRPIGIEIATTDPVFCRPHDGDQQGVGLLDNPESQLKSKAEQHMLLYKAICFSLFECERVLHLLIGIMERRPREVIKREIYFVEQQMIAHRDILSKFPQCLDGECDGACAVGSQLEFKRLFVKGDGIPTVSAIGCGSGLVNCGILFGCTSIGCRFPRAELMVACKPMETGHVVVIARTRSDHLESGYCRQANRVYSQQSMSEIFDKNPPQGAKLELFVSAELIESSKGFICSPDIWERYGSRMKDVVRHHLVEQPSRFRSERKRRSPTEINRKFNLFRSIS